MKIKLLLISTMYPDSDRTLALFFARLNTPGQSAKDEVGKRVSAKFYSVPEVSRGQFF